MNKKKYFSIGLIILCIIIIAFMLVPISNAKEPDDEREVSLTCSNPQYVGIGCLEGSIDCSPRDCP